MMRQVLALLTLVGVVVILSNSPLAAGSKGSKTEGKKGSQPHDAIIVTVDTKSREISVTIKEKGGKKEGGKKEGGKKEGGKKEGGKKDKGHQQHYKLTDAVKIVDASGKTTTLEVFKKGDHVKIVEIEGTIHELHHQGEGGGSKGKGGASKK